ncbi:major facilitator superfamily MFS_1 [Desulfobulbus propionicus DSM 2032]|jgi:MFS family permease|uniref:Major facilitator superfamily MFS_1 n=1 Tax=Desulfobulbus propionicus (strain ATCC 33891 / DSM 2032 / VKM B-1956 / 1pr3) TaxID=577650 RepID=A0A7U4DNN3_DESPD|nr:MFS transporter [Desulfobulbus propionicus]ADW17281.1 major facilitator superfamily MFS_1 [Desulfobulbus propionicus DSM 2032]
MTITSNILKLNIFAALKMMLFPMAIITVFWKDQIGLSLSEILLVNVFFSTANLLMEYPSGYVSDRLGYRLSLVIACVFGICGWTAYLFAHSFWHVIGAELLLGVCYAFISGSDNALLYETLRAGGRSELYTRCDGRMAGWAQIGEAGGALCAGLLYVTAPLLPFMVQIGVWVAALGVALSLREPHADKGPHITSHLSEALRIGRHGLGENKPLRATILLGMLLGLASFYPVWLVQPFMRESGVPLAWFGPIWAGANLMVAVCAYHSHKVLDLLGLRRIVLLFILLIVGAYAGLGLTSMIGSFLFYYLLTAMRGLQGPILRSLLQQHATRHMRASILSLHNLMFRLGYVVSGPLIGWVSDTRGLQTAFLTLACAFALLLPLAARSFLWHQDEDRRHPAP